jgi:hypothetical protein
MTTAELETALEALIDATDLTAVIDALAQVAGAKAEHIASNWQDVTTAKAWDRAALELAKAVGKIGGLGI